MQVDPATFIHLVLAFQSVINLAELCLIIKRVYTWTMLHVHARRYSLAILQTGRRASKVQRRVQKAQAEEKYKRPKQYIMQLMEG